jgi:hypothetical protein
MFCCRRLSHLHIFNILQLVTFSCRLFNSAVSTEINEHQATNENDKVVMLTSEV